MPQRAYRFRFYPNATQRGMLARRFSTGRWVWNRCLSWRSTTYRQDIEVRSSGDAISFQRRHGLVRHWDLRGFPLAGDLSPPGIAFELDISHRTSRHFADTWPDFRWSQLTSESNAGAAGWTAQT